MLGVPPLRTTLYTLRACKLAHVSGRNRLEATHARARTWRLRSSIKRSRVIANNWLWWHDTEYCATYTGGDSDSIDLINCERDDSLGSVIHDHQPRHRSLLTRPRTVAGTRLQSRSLFHNENASKTAAKTSAFIYANDSRPGITLRSFPEVFKSPKRNWCESHRKMTFNSILILQCYILVVPFMQSDNSAKLKKFMSSPNARFNFRYK